MMRHSKLRPGTAIPMRRSKDGRWYTPMSGMGAETYGPPVPADDSPKVGDDFFAPGEEEKMNQQIAAEKAVDEFKKKLWYVAYGVGFGLFLLAIFDRGKKGK